MKRNIFKNLIFILCLCILGIFLTSPSIYASTDYLNQDGKWEIAIKKDIAMGGENFSDSVIVEKQGDNYYLTFSILDINAISKMNLLLGNDKVGRTIEYEENMAHYTFTLSKDDLTKKLMFRVFINAMKTEKDFGITLDFKTCKLITTNIDKTVERPARFVPTINLTSGNTVMKKGSYYTIVPATATISNSKLDVMVSAYYLKNDEKVEVKIEDGRFMLENVGEYHVVYRAETNKYLNNLGKNSYSEIDLKILSKLNATNNAKVENISNTHILPNDVNVQATLADINSDTYLLASDLMIKLADNFEVMSVTLFDIDGNMLTPNDEFFLYLLANTKYDRNKIRVFHINDDNSLTELECDGYGRYVKLKTNLTGNFIIAEDGLAFVMPMWGYALLTIVGLVIVVTGIVVLIVLVKKKKRKLKQI